MVMVSGQSLGARRRMRTLERRAIAVLAMISAYRRAL